MSSLSTKPSAPTCVKPLPYHRFLTLIESLLPTLIAAKPRPLAQAVAANLNKQFPPVSCLRCDLEANPKCDDRPTLGYFSCMAPGSSQWLYTR